MSTPNPAPHQITDEDWQAYLDRTEHAKEDTHLIGATVTVKGHTSRWRVLAIDRRTTPTAVMVPVNTPHQRVPLGRDLLTVVDEEG